MTYSHERFNIIDKITPKSIYPPKEAKPYTLKAIFLFIANVMTK